MALPCILFVCSCSSRTQVEEELIETSEAGTSMDEWFSRRMDEHGHLDVGAWVRAFQASAQRSNDQGKWQAIGPKNIGGRTLCVAFHPTDPNIIYAGAASGGLWVTTSGGKGANAWQRIDIGFPVLGVSSILIDPQNPDRMWIGTGEMYNQASASPGTISRYTRGTYGIGILRSTDGGATWSASLDWTSGGLRAIQKLMFNPLDPNILYAATSEGLYRSDNGGDSWYKKLNQAMITDLWVHPTDTAQIVLTAGSFLTAGAGIYRSINSGNSFALITDGIPNGYTGKAMLGAAPSDPDQLYCSVANALQGIGLYHSNDRGAKWTLVNTTDIPKYQGWYAHALAVSPTDPDYLLYGGIDMHRSFNGGDFLIQTSYWEEWMFGKVPAGGPEGPPYYVHGDIHQIKYHPLVPDEAWIATDGGLFVTTDNGMNFSGRNGGYQTQQFYARFSNSAQDPDFGIGGLQDNATAIYEGDGDWIRVIGGDGMSTAIDPTDDNRILASAQGLVLFRSLNHGDNFEPVSGSTFTNESVPFNGSFQLDPQDPDKVYAGAQRVYRSTTFGELDSWTLLHPAPLDGDNVITGIEVSPVNGNHLVVITSSDPIQTGGLNTGKIRISTTGGTSWQTATGLPSRFCTDVAFHPLGSTLLATFSGFSTQNVYRSLNGGLSWAPWGSGLPGVPVNCIVFDPYESSHVYAGTDLGVYFSDNGGSTWTSFTSGLPSAALIMDLAISLPNKTIRAATHGLGAYESELVSFMVSTSQPSQPLLAARVVPNPASQNRIHLELTEPISGLLITSLVDQQGRVVGKRTWSDIGQDLDWKLDHPVPQGLYILTLESKLGRQSVRVFLLTD
ncbi:MAG: hypothetical protein IPJ06_05140 [Saprospiraceae bacterium]|nr:hypothetical protein [Saprospiraceae bacterium]